MRLSLGERFWPKVDVRNLADCWEWLASKDQNGYGRISVDSKPRLATHIVFKLRTGKWVPKGKQINHTCNNSGCLNPRHLRLGTQQSNMRYMVQCGRVKGENNGHAKLTDNEVCKIHKLLAQDITGADIAHIFGVCRSTISQIKTGHIWSHVSI